MILTEKEMLKWRDGMRHTTRPVVWTNGVFDLLHYGHLQSIRSCAALGGFLIVGVNSDDSARRIKRLPIIGEHQRANLVASLHLVDHVILFGEDTPSAIVSILKPDIFVKGEDYNDKDFPERAVVEGYGGQVKFVPLLEGVSTTGIIRQCWKSYQDEHIRPLPPK